MIAMVLMECAAAAVEPKSLVELREEKDFAKTKAGVKRLRSQVG